MSARSTPGPFFRPEDPVIPPSIPLSPGLPRRGLLRGAGAGALLLALSACRSAVGAGVPAGDGPPERGGTLRVATSTDLTPALLFSQSTGFSVHRLVFNTLTQYAPGTLDPRPQLATGWHLAADGRSVRLTLREDVRFHTGRPFTAEDVVFAVRNLQNPQRAAQLRTTALAVTGFGVHGPRELTLELAHPVANLFDLFEFMVIPDRETLSGALTGEHVVGTGPFTWKDWTPGASLRLARNPRYWVPDRPYLDAVDIRVIPQPDALLASLRGRQSHLAAGLSGRDMAALKGDRAYRIQEFEHGSGAVYLGVNTAVAPLGDKRVRQALAYAVDRERIVRQALGGYGMPSSTPWPRSSPAFDEAASRHYAHDPARAKALLAEAGHAEGLNLPLAFLSSSSAIAQMVQFDLGRVGVRTRLEPLDPAKFQAELIAQSMPALWTGVHGFASNQPSTLAVSAYPFNEERNTSRFQDARYTAVVRRAWRQADARSADARAACAELNHTLLDEAFIIGLAVLANLQPTATSVRGVAQNRFSAPVLDDAGLAAGA